MKKIKINGIEYDFKFTIKAMLYFERIVGKAFELNTMSDQLVLLYSCLLACNEDTPIQWNDFISAIDNDPNIFVEMQAVVNEKQQIEATLTPPEEAKKKARTRTKKK